MSPTLHSIEADLRVTTYCWHAPSLISTIKLVAHKKESHVPQNDLGSVEVYSPEVIMWIRKGDTTKFPPESEDALIQVVYGDVIKTFRMRGSAKYQHLDPPSPIRPGGTYKYSHTSAISHSLPKASSSPFRDCSSFKTEPFYFIQSQLYLNHFYRRFVYIYPWTC
ncbi:hypothetical protein T265_06366 [Opisthorchis viverrini]|uniref:Uncharacterized protein n=1 Tax=Opisthorchis viverrini TaxID=6198 RepID=A0A075ADY8_OPIVI|nr:hypothetical protein T265_06366 [Opisthorchis viverrini]KER26384.1 hypothetical protein T265_06366 [Opisthorchis viverrini]